MDFFKRRTARSSVTVPRAAPSPASISSTGALDPPPACKCGQPAVQRTVKKESANKGKHFFVCAKPQGEQCSYFDWADALPPRPADAPVTVTYKRVAERDLARPAKRAAAVGGVGAGIVLLLEEIGRVAFQLRTGASEAVWEAVRGFDGCEVMETGLLIAKKVRVAVERVFEFEALLKGKAGVEVEWGTPRPVLERVVEYRRGDRRRQEAGDMVTEGLDSFLPARICERMMDFQWEGVHFALRKGGKCLIGDDMGLGKTLQAIAVARVYMTDWPLLIVCPSSLRLNWKEELLEWLEGDVSEADVLVMMTGRDIERPIRKVNIVSYDLMRKMPPAFVKRCGFVIADESHYLKSGQAKRSKAVVPLIKNARRALLLSGTPALSRPVELYAQINAVAPVLFPNYQDFVERYCAAHAGRFGYDVSGASNLDELHTLLRGSVLIRRKKEEVLTQLPEKQRQVLWVQTKPKVMKDMAKAFVALERAKERANEAQSEAQAAVLQNEVKKAQNELYSLTGMAKIDAVMEFCKDTAETGCKFIVFVHHKEVMEQLDDYLRMKLKLGVIRIDGTTPQANRQMLCKRFQENAQSRVALLSITAAGVGLTLTEAKVVLFAELYWNPGSLLQAEDRAHRIGQRDCVLVKYLLAKKSLDESMWSMVRRKLNVVGHSLTGAAAKMEVADGKETGNGIKRPIGSFFKARPPKMALGPTQRSVGTQDDEVVEVVDVDASLSPNAEATQAADADRGMKANGDDGMFPLSLSELEDGSVREGMRGADEKAQTGGWTGLRAGQEHMDADIALAQKLQAQFDRESGG